MEHAGSTNGKKASFALLVLLKVVSFAVIAWLLYDRGQSVLALACLLWAISFVPLIRLGYDVITDSRCTLQLVYSMFAVRMLASALVLIAAYQENWPVMYVVGIWTFSVGVLTLYLTIWSTRNRVQQ